MYVCVCNAVTDKHIRRAVNDGTDTMRGLKHQLGVADCCGRCAPCARQVLQDCLHERDRDDSLRPDLALQPV